MQKMHRGTWSFVKENIFFDILVVEVLRWCCIFNPCIKDFHMWHVFSISSNFYRYSCNLLQFFQAKNNDTPTWRGAAFIFCSLKLYCTSISPHHRWYDVCYIISSQIITAEVNVLSQEIFNRRTLVKKVGPQRDKWYLLLLLGLKKHKKYSPPYRRDFSMYVMIVNVAVNWCNDS